jgi:hypothetical protein
MRCHRFLFVLASAAALSIAAFAGFDNDRSVVSDLQAANLVGGDSCTTWSSQNCGTGCQGGCIRQKKPGSSGSNFAGIGLGNSYCGGGPTSCGLVASSLTGCA